MRKQNLKSVGVGALALLMSVPVFAQSRNDFRGDRQHDDYRNENNRSSSSRSYRENERVTVQGKVSSFTHERNGYRVQLDRGRDSYWVPESYFRNRGRNLRVGISVVLGGVFRGGSIYVDDVNYPDGYGYGQGYVRGVIQGIDYRAGTAWLRDDASGRSITVDLRRTNERRLRRGEYVELSGSWDRGGLFDVYRIERVR
jgi:uncharacterized protein YdeI (BOF family)